MLGQSIVPTLRVGMPPGTLRVPPLEGDAERHGMHSHAERGNDRYLRLIRRSLLQRVMGFQRSQGVDVRRARVQGHRRGQGGGDFFAGGAGLDGGVGVYADAAVTARGDGDSDGDQLTGLGIEHIVLSRGFVQGHVGLDHLRIAFAQGAKGALDGGQQFGPVIEHRVDSYERDGEVRPCSLDHPCRSSPVGDEKNTCAPDSGRPGRQQLQGAMGVGRHFFLGQVRLVIQPLDVRLGLILVMPVERHAALANGVDGDAVARVGEVDDAPGRRPVGHRPWCRADLGGEVVGHLVGAGRRERTDIENPVQWFLHAQRVVVGQGVGLAPLPLRGVFAEGGLQVGEALVPGLFHGVGTGLLAEGRAVIPPR